MSRLLACCCTALVAWVAGCSAIVQPPGSELKCQKPRSPDGTDPCPGELVCTDAGICDTPPGGEGCEDAPDGGTDDEEKCNGIDDDCDGTLDEGHDLDGDGFTWCGSGEMARQDCDDNDDTVFPAIGGDPGGTERCNGQDDDCDGTVDEDPPGGPLCSGEERCLPLEGGCIEPDCTITGCPDGERCDLSSSPPECTTEGPERCEGDTDCDAGFVCDVETGNCLEPKPLGEPCTIDAECESRVCMSASALRLGDGRVCGKACCSDADCNAGNVCWVSGSGARSCLPPEVAGVSPPGSSPPGDSCTTGDKCPSGICGGSTVGCVAHCTFNAQCSTGACTLAEYEINGRTMTDFVCNSPPGDGDFGEVCDRDDDCRSGVCIEVPWPFEDYCSRACGTQGDCPTGAICDSGQVPGDDDWVTACFYSGSGDEPLCCRDEQCSGDDECKGVSRGGGLWQMTCQ